MKPRLALFIVASLLLLLTGSTPIMAQDEGKPAPVGLRPDAPTYALHGPYWVGTQTIELDQGTDNYHRFTIWYPALNPEGLPEEVVYQMSEKHLLHELLPPDADAPYTVLGHALSNAAPDLSSAPYPLVIYSHGFTAQMWSMGFGEHVASYGFVVIAPEHANDSWEHVYVSHIIRMMDVKRAIKDAEMFTAQGGILEGMIDVEQIALGGHSSGGAIDYGAAGAPIYWSEIEAFCEAEPDVPDCADLAGQFQQVLDLLGIEAPLDKILPPIWDSRMDAIFPMAGSVEMQGEQGLKAVTIPMMAMYGTLDPYAKVMIPAYASVSSQQKAEVVFQNANHGIFYPECEVFPYLAEYDLFWACSDMVWDLSRAQDLTNHLVTAFLLDVLKGNETAHAALAPDAVSFPGITYEAQGY